jgi:cysteine desulfurase
MDECLTIDGNFGNPSSASHVYGLRARDAVELARAQVANLINAKAQEIIWTSCATEANNLAIKGASHFYVRKGKHIITCQTEHKSVLNVFKHLETEDYEVTYLTPEKNGLIDLNKLQDAIRKDTILVSIMFVNSEIGIIQDIKAIGDLVKPYGIVFHVDATQAAGKLPIDVKILPVDLMSFSAHKVYGPKGIGMLYVRHKPRIRLEPQIHGSGHEFSMRSGTLPVHQIVGMGEAFQIAKQEGLKDSERVFKLRNKLWEGIKFLGDIYLNGDLKKRVAHNLNVSFGGIRGDKLIAALTDIAVSTSAACIAEGTEPSYVLKAIGVNNVLALSSVRFSLGKFTSEQEIDYAIQHINQVINKLRGKS